MVVVVVVVVLVVDRGPPMPISTQIERPLLMLFLTHDKPAQQGFRYPLNPLQNSPTSRHAQISFVVVGPASEVEVSTVVVGAVGVVTASTVEVGRVGEADCEFATGESSGSPHFFSPSPTSTQIVPPQQAN